MRAAGGYPSPLVAAEERRALAAARAEAEGAPLLALPVPRSQLAGLGGARLTAALGIG